MMAADLVDMLAGPGNAGNAGVAVGRKTVDARAVVRDAAPPASHGRHGCCRRGVDWPCRQIHWDRTVLDSLVDGVEDQDLSWGVVRCFGRLDGNRSGVAEYAVDDGRERHWERAATRWHVSGWSSWVGFAAATGGHARLALPGEVCRHRRRRRLDWYGH